MRQECRRAWKPIKKSSGTFLSRHKEISDQTNLLLCSRPAQVQKSKNMCDTSLPAGWVSTCREQKLCRVLVSGSSVPKGTKRANPQLSCNVCGFLPSCPVQSGQILTEWTQLSCGRETRERIQVCVQRRESEMRVSERNRVNLTVCAVIWSLL